MAPVQHSVVTPVAALTAAVLLALGGPSLAQAQSPTNNSAPANNGAAAAQRGLGGAAAQSNESPSDVVQTAAQSMLKALDADREAYRKDPAKVGQLVDKYLLPHFDTEFSARLVLGQHWRTATPEQRKRFIDAFYHSLLNNYGSALADFTADKLKVYPTTVEPNATRATVRTDVKRNNGDRVSVNYYMHKTPEGWKAWDVVIDGISYVNSYREDFGSQIDQQGLDAVINRLEKGEKPSEIGKTTGSKAS
jgi:phospholipid transport system substrate-binding protein